MDTWMLSKQETVTNLTKGRGKELVIRARCGSLSARDLQIFCCSWDMKVAMANVAMFFAISSVLRKNGSSIAATIVAPMLVNVVLSFADSLLKLRDVSLTNYWLSSFLGDLTLSVESGRMTVCLVASLIYIPVFVFAGIRINRKIEL